VTRSGKTSLIAGDFTVKEARKFNAVITAVSGKKIYIYIYIYI